ncbi:hypothetical protein XENORESO_017170 [Xenotaenia resolanae]|uniref:Secreted protein n=1 Tax=Xenotaenia resolanae TaxID=208358 RepID=A0ABV0XAN6_9TELE
MKPLKELLLPGTFYFLQHRKYFWISASVFFFVYARSSQTHSRSWQMAVHIEPDSAGGVTTCMLSMRDCCKINASDIKHYFPFSRCINIPCQRLIYFSHSSKWERQYTIQAYIC